MKTWSDGVVESWSVRLLRIRASLQYSSTPIFRFRLRLTLCAVLFALCSPAQAQQPGKVARIGILDPSTASGSAILWEAFRQQLHKLAWVEGQNITIDYRFAEQKDERLRDLAIEFVGRKVDLIVVPDTPSTLAATKASITIPVVMTNSADPVGAGLVASLARPGGNVTGLSSLSPELSTKRLEIVRDAVPKLARVGLLRPTPSGSRPSMQVTAAALKLKLEEIDIQIIPKKLNGAFEDAKQKQVDAIIIPADRALFAERKRIVELAGNYRLPAIYFQKEFVDVGGLMSYGADYDDLYRRAATYVDKILKGAKPADLPVEQPRKFEFVINLKAAKQIGITIPQSVLYRADKVIK